MTTRAQRVTGWTRPEVRELKPYYKAPLEGDPLRLDQNTNLAGPNPAIAKVDARKLDAAQYPSRDADDLLEALSEFHGIPSDHFMAGNGGDELLELLVKAFGDAGSTLAVPAPTYSLYPEIAKAAGLRFKTVPTKGGFATLDVEALAAAKARMVWVANPNNPTGARYNGGDLERLLSAVDGVVLVDEAYIEYAGLKHSLIKRVEEFDNLVILRTFSKAYGLAGLRIGYLAANRELASRLRLAKPPFNVNVYSEAVAVAALDEQEWVDDCVRTVRAERERMAADLKALGFRVHPSEANFLLTEPPIDAGELLLALRKAGILARTFPTTAGLERTIRFTVGGPEHTDTLLWALQSIVKEARA
ncbi:MAG: histidinol-phosphate aminotransferase [Thermoplasmata archaeon]|nr:histidinol-phosphate aminotransferase [Thermoplasmata archaeon]